MTTKELAADRMEAQLDEADARLEMLEAQAEARKAKDEMDEISGLRAAREKVRKDLADLKRQTAATADAAKRKVEEAIAKLDAGIDHAMQKYGETTLGKWDAAAERRLFARLDEAEARVRGWKAKAEQKRAGTAMKIHDDVAELEEDIALARARSAAAAFDRHDRKAQEALLDAARHFDEAYEAASKRYGV